LRESSRRSRERVDRVMLMRQGAVNALRLLRHRIDPAALITAHKPGAGAPAGHLIEHRDVPRRHGLGCGRENVAGLLDVLCLHRKVQIEQNRVVRHLEPFDMKMMLGKTDRVVAEIVGEPHLLRDVAQHSPVKLGAQPGEPGLDLTPVAGGRKTEKAAPSRSPPLAYSQITAIFDHCGATADRGRTTAFVYLVLALHVLYA
jgi:hypothetical protein